MTQPPILDHWRAVCGSNSSQADDEAIHRWLTSIVGSLLGDSHAKETAVADVLLAFRGRRARLLARLATNADGDADGGASRHLCGLAHTHTTVEEAEDALCRPLSAAEAAVLHDETPLTEARLSGLARKALTRQLISGARRDPRRSKRHSSVPAAGPREVGLDDKAHEKNADPPLNPADAKSAAEQPILLERAQHALESAEARWASGETQSNFASWRAEGRGAFANRPGLVLETIALLEAAATSGVNPFEDDTARKSAHRLRASLTTLDQSDPAALGRGSWPLARLAAGEEPFTVYADAQVATDRTRSREAAAPAVRRPAPTRE